MFILGFVIALFALAMTAVFLGGEMADLVDIPSLCVILVPLLGILTATNSFKVFFRGMKAVILPKKEISEELCNEAISLFRMLSKATAIISSAGFIICLVNVLFALDFNDPIAINVIGPNIAAALITPLYGLVLIAVLFGPIVFILNKKFNGRKQNK